MKFRVDYYAEVSVHAVRTIEAPDLKTAEAMIEREREDGSENEVLKTLSFDDCCTPINTMALSSVDVLTVNEPPCPKCKGSAHQCQTGDPGCMHCDDEVCDHAWRIKP